MSNCSIKSSHSVLILKDEIEQANQGTSRDHFLSERMRGAKLLSTIRWHPKKQPTTEIIVSLPHATTEKNKLLNFVSTSKGHIHGSSTDLAFHRSDRKGTAFVQLGRASEQRHLFGGLPNQALSSLVNAQSKPTNPQLQNALGSLGSSTYKYVLAPFFTYIQINRRLQGSGRHRQFL